MIEPPPNDRQASVAEDMNQALARCYAELESLRQSEAQWRDVFRRAPVPMSLTSAVDGRLCDVNHRYSNLTGHAPAELIGRRLSEVHLLPLDSSQERIAGELIEREAVDDVAHYIRRADGTLRPALSSLQLIAQGAQPLILSSTVDVAERSAKEKELSEQADAQRARVAELEAEIAEHRDQERRLIGQVTGLCTEASLLKSDIIKLKQMQQELNTEMDSLRKYAERLTDAEAQARPSPVADLTATTPSETKTTHTETTHAEPSPAATVASAAGNDQKDAMWAVAAARLQDVEEQLIKHVAALRLQAASMHIEGPTA